MACSNWWRSNIPARGVKHHNSFGLARKGPTTEILSKHRVPHSLSPTLISPFSSHNNVRNHHGLALPLRLLAFAVLVISLP